MTRHTRWLLVALVAFALLGAAVGRAIMARRAPPPPPPQVRSVELAPADVVRAQRTELVGTLAMSQGLLWM